MRIALATEADVAAIARLAVTIVDAERQAAIVRDSIAGGECYVAWRDGEPAGFITWDRGFFNRPFVRLLGVGLAFRRERIGRALLAHVESAAASLRELFISTEERNLPMRALLAAAHYRPSGWIDHLNAPGNAELVYYKRL